MTYQNNESKVVLTLEGNSATVTVTDPNRVVEAHDLAGYQVDDLEMSFDNFNMDYYRNPSDLADHVFKAVALGGSQILSLDEIRAAIEADVNDPDEMHRLATVTMTDLYPANEYKWQPDLVGQCIYMLLGLHDFLGKLRPMIEEPINKEVEWIRSGARLTRVGRILKEVIFGTDPNVVVK